MTYGVYVIRDAKTGFLTPTVDMNDQSAMRNFAHAAMQQTSLFFTHPQDYSLWKIGEYDTESGLLTALQAPEHIVEATSFKEV